MSPEPNKQTIEASAETQSAGSTFPAWLVIGFFVLVYWGMIYFDTYGGWFSSQVYAPYHSTNELALYQIQTGDDWHRGQKPYEAVCGLCHKPDGMGVPGQFPPLAGSEWANGSINRLVRIPLAGLNGPVTVKGTPWNLAMPAMGAAMSDDDLAAALSYIRHMWGNASSDVTAEDVKKIRGQVANHAQPFTAGELQSVPEK